MGMMTPAEIIAVALAILIVPSILIAFRIGFDLGFDKGCEDSIKNVRVIYGHTSTTHQNEQAEKKD